MSDSFGKITGFMLTAALLFIVPVCFYANRQQNLTQLFIINKSVQLVEAVRNTGVLTEDMYRSFEDSILDLGGRYDIELVRSSAEYNQNEHGDYTKSDATYYTAQLTEELKEEGFVSFLEEDYVYIQVTRTGKGLLEKIGAMFLGDALPEEEVVAFYGGYVKNESY